MYVPNEILVPAGGVAIRPILGKTNVEILDRPIIIRNGVGGGYGNDIGIRGRVIKHHHGVVDHIGLWRVLVNIRAEGDLPIPEEDLELPCSKLIVDLIGQVGDERGWRGVLLIGAGVAQH
ncbi:hypothetical protein [Methylocaldum szegediense]|uniref:hypothetical protein n=1 Tax=Methylocaldum szegediense TaxID=73780 RepID=UPI00138ADD7C|nr:hypothetical protein [Methylocaldum szegediense]